MDIRCGKRTIPVKIQNIRQITFKEIMQNDDIYKNEGFESKKELTDAILDIYNGKSIKTLKLVSFEVLR